MRRIRIETRWSWGLAVVVSLMALGAPEAEAQGRIYFSELPDMPLTLALSDVLVDEYGEVTDETKLHMDFEAMSRNFKDLGLHAGDGAWSEVELGAGLGIGFWHRSFVVARTEMALPFRLSEAEVGGEEEEEDPFSTNLRGWHRLLGQIGLGDARSDELSAELEVGYSLRHDGRRPLGVAPHWLGPVPYTQERLEAKLRPQFSDEDGSVFVTPLGYALDTIVYDGDLTPVRRVERQAFSSGVGFRGVYDEIFHGHIEIIGATYARTSYEGGLGVRCPYGAGDECPPLVTSSLLEAGALIAPGATREVEQIDLRLFNLPRLSLVEKREFFAEVSVDMGWRWLWSDDRAADASIPFMGMAMGAHGTDFTLDSGFSLGGGTSPEGSRFVGEFRWESKLRVEPEDWLGGASIDLALASMDDLEVEEEDVTLKGAVHSTWYLKPHRDFRAGAYHTANYTPMTTDSYWNPWGVEGTWAHELGLFVSYHPSLIDADSPAPERWVR